MNSEEHCLIALIRSIVSQRPIKLLSMLGEAVEWNNIKSIATRQGVSATTLDAVALSSDAMRPKGTVLMQWVAQTAMQERMYAQHKECIASLAAFYAQHNIKTLLLKGYGCSLYWPKPEHRPIGDIDIYLFGKQNEADAIVERELGIKVHCEYHKHSTFGYHGVEVENHAKFIDDVSHKSNIRFEQTLMALLKEDECLKSPIDNVLLPPPTFNALFLLRHTGEHFASNEITLRQVLDVGTFFRTYQSMIDWKTVMAVYQRERMEDFFNGIATICVEYLGIEVGCFASSDKHYSYRHDIILADRILNDIFEQKKALPMSMAGVNTIGKKFGYAMSKSHRWWQNRWKYRLVYDENLFESFCWLAKNRLFH